MSELCKAVQQTQVVVEKNKPVSTYIPKITSSLPKTEFIITANNDNKQNSKCDENNEKNNGSDKNNDNDNKSNSDLEDTFNVQNGESHIVPPKPLPRSSRTGSICEAPEDTTTPRPVARPRTTNYTPVVTSVNPNAPITGGYKV